MRGVERGKEEGWREGGREGGKVECLLSGVRQRRKEKGCLEIANVTDALMRRKFL